MSKLFNQTFSFFGNDKIYQMDITDKIILNMNKTSPSTAVMFFTDEKNQLIPIPKGIELHDITYGGVNNAIINNQFCLAYSSSYKLFYNGKLLLNVNHQRQWKLESTTEMNVVKYKIF